MTSGSGDLKLKLLLALRELVASDAISVRLRRVARGIHTLVDPTFHLTCRKYGNDFTR
jgi:hypothetical protein